MGEMYDVICKKCGNRIALYNTGIGFRYMEVNEEVRKAIQMGKYGLEARIFLREHSACEVVTWDAVFSCEKCGKLMNKKAIKLIDNNCTFEKTYTCKKCDNYPMKRLEIDSEFERKLRRPCDICGETEDIEVVMGQWD